MTLSIQNYLRSSPCARAVLYSVSAAATVVLQWRLSTLFRALLMCLSAVLVLKLMATLVSTLIFDSSCSKTFNTSVDDLYARGLQDYSTRLL